MAPSFSCRNKRPLDVVVYAAAAAAAAADNKHARHEDEDEASTSSSSSSVALSLHAASASRPFGDSKPINALPISAVPRLPPPLRRAPPAVAGRAEPPCLREHFLERLGLRADLPVHFIDVKHLTSTDLDPHQNRLRIPWDGAVRRLRPLLTPAELHAANLLVLPDPKPKAPKKRPAEPQQEGAVDQGKKKVKKPKAKGKAHGRLRVNLVGLAGGAKQLLSRWDSSVEIRGAVKLGWNVGLHSEISTVSC